MASSDPMVSNQLNESPVGSTTSKRDLVMKVCAILFAAVLRSKVIPTHSARRERMHPLRYSKRVYRLCCTYEYPSADRLVTLMSQPSRPDKRQTPQPGIHMLARWPLDQGQETARAEARWGYFIHSRQRQASAPYAVSLCHISILQGDATESTLASREDSGGPVSGASS